MQKSQSLRFRTADVFARDSDELSMVHPERRRQYVRVGPGAFRGALRERSIDTAALGS
jgi:hypothetical protein